MKNIRLVVNNFSPENNIYFDKKELKTILNLYARMVSDGFWKDYSLDISKNRISFTKSTQFYRVLFLFCYFFKSLLKESFIKHTQKPSCFRSAFFAKKRKINCTEKFFWLNIRLFSYFMYFTV